MSIRFLSNCNDMLIVQRFLTLHVLVGHGSDSEDQFRVDRIQLRDVCFRFLEESITFQFFCIICVMLLGLCTVLERWNFFTRSWLVASCSTYEDASHNKLTTSVTSFLSKVAASPPWLCLGLDQTLVIGLPIQPLLLECSQIRSFNAFIVRSPSPLLTNLRFSPRAWRQRRSTSPDCVLDRAWFPRRSRLSVVTRV